MPLAPAPCGGRGLRLELEPSPSLSLRVSVRGTPLRGPKFLPRRSAADRPRLSSTARPQARYYVTRRAAAAGQHYLMIKVSASRRLAALIVPLELELNLRLLGSRPAGPAAGPQHRNRPSGRHGRTEETNKHYNGVCLSDNFACA